MRIDAIIQSTGYHDMLALTLPQNKGHFDSVIVYTKRGDEKTKEVCAREGVSCVETDRFSQNGSKFNRGAVYNEAFQALVQRGALHHWVCIIDSDIILPHHFREEFEELDPDTECFYGARRYNVETMEQYAEVQRRGQDALDRLILFRGYGYGYLQIFNMNSSTFIKAWNGTRGNPYLEWHDGSWADCHFRLLWGDAPWNPPTQPPDHILDHSVPEPCDPPTGLLRKLPFNVVHLGVTGCGANGRGTPLWT